MKRLALTITCTALLGLGLTGCGETKENSPAAAPPAASAAASSAGSAFPKGDEGAKDLMEALRTTTDPKVVLQLKPTADDYKAVFTDELAGKAEQFYATKLWNGEDIKLAGSAAQTEVTFFKATSEDIRAWKPAVEKDFPGGYEQLGKHLKPGLTLYRWKYTEPGVDSGRAYEGLVHVNGHWIWVPKAWEILEA